MGSEDFLFLSPSSTGPVPSPPVLSLPLPFPSLSPPHPYPSWVLHGVGLKLEGVLRACPVDVQGRCLSYHLGAQRAPSLLPILTCLGVTLPEIDSGFATLADFPILHTGKPRP